MEAAVESRVGRKKSDPDFARWSRGPTGIESGEGGVGANKSKGSRGSAGAGFF
jgi:hypothetical protein